MTLPPKRVTYPIFIRTKASGFVPVQTSNHQGAFIKREIAELAYVEYERQYGTDQSFDRLHERGGFGISEIIVLLAETIYRFETKKVI